MQVAAKILRCTLLIKKKWKHVLGHFGTFLHSTFKEVPLSSVFNSILLSTLFVSSIREKSAT